MLQLFQGKQRLHRRALPEVDGDMDPTGTKDSGAQSRDRLDRRVVLRPLPQLREGQLARSSQKQMQVPACRHHGILHRRQDLRACRIRHRYADKDLPRHLHRIRHCVHGEGYFDCPRMESFVLYAHGLCEVSFAAAAR